MTNSELWTTEQVRAFLGAKTIRSASRTLNRLGIKPVATEPGKPGRVGKNLYDADEVRREVAAMPRRARGLQEKD